MPCLFSIFLNPQVTMGKGYVTKYYKVTLKKYQVNPVCHYDCRCTYLTRKCLIRRPFNRLIFQLPIYPLSKSLNDAHLPACMLTIFLHAEAHTSTIC